MPYKPVTASEAEDGSEVDEDEEGEEDKNDYVIGEVHHAVWGDAEKQPAWEFNPSKLMCQSVNVTTGRMAKVKNEPVRDVLATRCLGEKSCKVSAKRGLFSAPGGKWDTRRTLALSASVTCVHRSESAIAQAKAKEQQMSRQCRHGCLTCAAEDEASNETVIISCPIGSMITSVVDAVLAPNDEMPVGSTG